ncbi:hypothetical protein GCM10027036_23390 [Flavihumibacter cheonanensis]
MLIYNRYEVRWTLTIIALILIGIGLLLNKLTGGIIYSYCDKAKSKTTSNILIGIQWTTSILLAFILPNNILNNYIFFQKLYDDNELWIPLSMGVVLYTSLTTIGLFFNLALRDK